MKLLLRRNQRDGMLGKVVFTLSVRADLTAEEREHIRKYKLGNVLLYEKKPLKEGGNEYQKLGRFIAYSVLNLTITVNNLDEGKSVECKDILEMLAVEDQIREAAQTFKAILTAAATFGGEEVVELA